MVPWKEKYCPGSTWMCKDAWAEKALAGYINEPNKTIDVA
jgi:hypothetical protein